MNGGRFDASWKRFTDGINPFNQIIGIAKSEIRIARNILSKEYSSYHKARTQAETKFNNASNSGSINDVVSSFSDCKKAYSAFLKRDAEMAQAIILSVREEFLAVKKIKTRTKVNKEFNQQEQEIIRAFLDHTKKWFDSAVTHDSFRMQLSDDLSLRNEMLHLMDPLNLQRKTKIVDRDLSKFGKDVNKAEASGKPEDVKKEEADYKKLNADLTDYFKYLDILFIDLVKLMLLHKFETTKNLRDKIVSLKGFEKVEKAYAELKKMSAELDKDSEDAFTNLTNNMNGLINIERSA